MRTRHDCWLLALLTILVLNGLAYGYEFRVRERFVADAEHPDYVPGEVLVAFKPGTPDRAIYEIHERCGARAAYPSSSGRFERAKVGNGKSVEEMIAAYQREPDVYYAEPNYIAYAFFVPNDPLYRYQWHFHSPEDAPGGVNLERAWDISTGKDVIVAVLDTGVAYENYRGFRRAPDLVGTCFVPGYDFVDDDPHSNDENGHGTHVAGVIAQRTNNGAGGAGAAFDCCIMPVRVLGKDGYGTYSMIADGVDFAVDNDAKVINMSLGSDWPSETLEHSLARAHKMGVILVAAAGNEYFWASPGPYPASYDKYCITVAAVRYDGRRAPYSNIGDYIDISAPGGDLRVDQNRDGFPDGILQQSFVEDPRDFEYIYREGTSFAAPHVSAAAAMLISHGVTHPDAVVAVLTRSARDVGKTGWDPEYGHGILDVYTALKYVSKIAAVKGSGKGAILSNRDGRIVVKTTDEDDTDGSESAQVHSKDEYGNESLLEKDAQVSIASSSDMYGLPNSTCLYQNYPNPFNPDTWIPYQLKEDAYVVISVYTPTGQLVRTLNPGYKRAGFYTDKEKAAYWDGNNEAGEIVASGVYFYSIKAGDFTGIQRMAITR